MRPMFAYLKATTVPTAVFAASEDWGGGAASAPSTSAASGLSQRIDLAAAELADLVTGRPATQSRVSGLADPVPFEELLGR